MLAFAWNLKGLARWCGIALISNGALYSQPRVLTWHNDNGRTGQNLQEVILTPSNVKSTTFGKLFTLAVDGKVDAQPLYVPGLTIPAQGVHNVVYIATEHDSVYAFDADNGTLLKNVSLIGTNETTSDVRNCSSQVSPEIGITSTPVIDTASGAHGAIYVVAMTKDNSSNYHQRIHALDLTTLSELFNGPVEVVATYAGTGSEKAISNATVQTFQPAQHKERAALLLSNGIVYTSWSSHCDIGPYTSWVIGYNETTLAQTMVLNLVPNGNDGGIWGSGSGPQADASGNIYLPTGNGTFDTSLLGNGLPSQSDYGNAYVKMTPSGSSLTVADYFTMSNTSSESGGDTDLGSGGGMLLPPLNDSGGHSHNLAVVAGKDTNIYVMDTANLGKFNPSVDEIYQQMSGVLGGGEWSSPAWFNGALYYGAEGNVLKAFTFANGLFGTNPASQSSVSFEYPGTTPSISANGTSNGIVWAAENSSPAVLHAYQAGNLSDELYNSNQAANGRDQFGDGNKFVFPTIVNGKVYVAGTGTCSGNSCQGEVGVFGLLSTVNPVSVTPNAGSGSSQTFAFAFSDSNGATDISAAQMDINATLASSGACYFYYARASNAIYLANDAGAWQGPLTIAGSGTLQNSQCSLNAASSSVTSSGNTLTLNLAVSFFAAFTGAKNIYMEVANASQDSGWSSHGSFTVTASGGGSPTPPATVSVTPNSGSGSSQTFAFAFSDGSGAADIASAQMDINATLTASNACYFYYARSSNAIYLAGNTGAWQGPLSIGSAGTLSNSQCSVSSGSSSVTSSGNNLTLSLAVSFTAAFAGAKNIYMEVRNATEDSGWSSRGTWTVTGASSPPAAVSVTPSSGSALSQTFAFVFSDGAGATDIAAAQLDINATLTSSNACYVYYARGSNAIYLAGNTGAWQGPLTIGSAGTLANSQCSVNSGNSSMSTSGNNLTLNLAMSFAAGFAGAKNIYMEVQNAAQSSGWSTKGSWTVP